MINKIFKFISNIVTPVTDMVDEISTTDEEKKQLKNKLLRIQNDLAVAVMKHEQQTIDAQKEIIKAEIKGSWLTQNWRPILMITIVAIVANNYLIYPYMSLFGLPAVVLDLPEKLWHLMELGVGGYVVGRSGEKIAKNLKNKKNK